MNVINYVCVGKLGDFFHCLYVIKRKWEETGKKGVIYLTQTYFTFPVEKMKVELEPILLAQNYIERIADLNEQIPEENINLDVHNCPLLYRSDWISILDDKYKLSKSINPVPWIDISLKKKELSDTILIHENKYYTLDPILKNIVSKNKVLFISCDENEYKNFQDKDKCPFYNCKDLYELFIAINSCKLFIAAQSSPLVCGTALGVPCLAKLKEYWWNGNNGGDSMHYIGVENYNKNFFWFTDDMKRSKLDGLEKIINI